MISIMANYTKSVLQCTHYAQSLGHFKKKGFHAYGKINRGKLSTPRGEVVPQG
jgi:hypothetical protein